MSAQSLRASTIELLRAWQAPTSDADSLRHTVLAFLDAAPDGCLRSSVPGHVTASTIVFDEGLENVLLTLHPRVSKWIQLGGHCEPQDESILDAATREAREESGMTGLTVTGDLVAIHTHPITCSLGQPTRHLDLRFVAVASGARPPVVRTEESIDLAWWPVNALPDNTELPQIPELIARAQTTLASWRPRAG